MTRRPKAFVPVSGRGSIDRRQCMAGAEAARDEMMKSKEKLDPRLGILKG